MDAPDLLVAMNQPRWRSSSLPWSRAARCCSRVRSPASSGPPGVTLRPFPAMRIAEESGTPKAANTAFLGAMVELGLLGMPEADVLAALDASFSEKPALVERNRKVYEAAKAWVRNGRG